MLYILTFQVLSMFSAKCLVFCCVFCTGFLTFGCKFQAIFGPGVKNSNLQVSRFCWEPWYIIYSHKCYCMISLQPFMNGMMPCLSDQPKFNIVLKACLMRTNHVNHHHHLPFLAATTHSSIKYVPVLKFHDDFYI